ncbi:MAG TPA: glycosyltransferase family 39 protein [Polyangiaceae bacterium]
MPVIAVAWSVCLIGRANLWALSPEPMWLNQDEGYVAALAYRMIHGQWLPYVDGVSHRGPVLYYVAALWLHAFGVTLQAVRWLAFVCSALVAVMVFIAGRAAGRPLVGAFAALLWAITTVGWDLLPGDGIAFNGELVANLFVLSALACLTAALRERSQSRPSLLFVTGTLASLGMLTKQTAALAVLPFMIWIVAAALARTEWRPRERARWVLLFAGGVCLPLGVLGIRYAIAGELSSFWYYFVEYNRDVYMAPFRDTGVFERLGNSVAPVLPLASLIGALTAGFLLSLFKGRGAAAALDRSGFAAVLLVGTVVFGLTVNAPMRGFGHYYLSLFPWTALLAGDLLDRAVLAARHQVSAASGMLLALAVAAHWGWSRQYGSRATESARLPPLNPMNTPLCQYLSGRTKPWDPVFIWGFYAEAYVSCRVSPATRYVYTTFPAGVVPWFESTLEQENARSVSGSRGILIRELEQSQPRVIVDASGSLMGRSLRRYAELAAYLDRHYCPDGKLFYGDLYVRKGTSEACSIAAQ